MMQSNLRYVGLRREVGLTSVSHRLEIMHLIKCTARAVIASRYKRLVLTHKPEVEIFWREIQKLVMGLF